MPVVSELAEYETSQSKRAVVRQLDRSSALRLAKRWRISWNINKHGRLVKQSQTSDPISASQKLYITISF
jgi:hypothetical protein